MGPGIPESNILSLSSFLFTLTLGSWGTGTFGSATFGSATFGSGTQGSGIWGSGNNNGTWGSGNNQTWGSGTEAPWAQCIEQYLGDFYCDDANNNEACAFDHGDCCNNDAVQWDTYCTECACLDPAGS